MTRLDWTKPAAYKRLRPKPMRDAWERATGQYDRRREVTK